MSLIDDSKKTCFTVSKINFPNSHFRRSLKLGDELKETRRHQDAARWSTDMYRTETTTRYYL